MAVFASSAFGGTTGQELSAFDSAFSKHAGSSDDAIITAAGRLRATTTAQIRYIHSATPASADYSVQADVHVASSAGAPRAYVMGRADAAANTHYSAGLQETSGSINGFTFQKVVSGSTTTLGRDTTITYTSPNTCVLDMAGTTIRGLWNGSEIFSVTDSDITAAGKAGLLFQNSSSPSDSATYHLDNWQAEEAGGGPSPQTVTTGQATETDTAQSLTAATTRTVAIGQAAETDAAQALTPVTGGGAQAIGIGQAAESDTAQALSVVAVRAAAIAQAQETDTAQVMSPVVGGATLIGQASETDSAQALTAVPGVRTVAIGQAAEVDSAQAMSARAAATILAGMALEIDTAQPLTALISGASLVIGQAIELDIAQALANIGGASSWTPGDGAMSPPRIGMARNGELWTLVIDDDNVPTHAKRRGTTKLVKVHALPGGNQGQVMTATGVVLVVM